MLNNSPSPKGGLGNPGQECTDGSVYEGSTFPCWLRGRESSRLPLESSLTQGQQVITWKGLWMTRIYHGRLILQLCEARHQPRTSLIFQSSRAGFCWGDLQPGNWTELPQARGSTLMGFNRMYSVVLPQDCGVSSPFDGSRARWLMLQVQEKVNSNGFNCA